MRRFILFAAPATAVILMLVLSPFSAASATEAQKPAQQDKCPVCGMFVAKYPDWTAEIIFDDGSTVFFDGAKDLFKYYFNMKKYNPQKTPKEIAAVFVMEYYEMEPIDARAAFFVIGSDVYGPMGRELIPFKNEADARQFMADHQGKQMLRFERVTPAVIVKLD